MSIAICPGSFDPITLGHLDIIERSTYIYDEVVVAVGESPSKKAVFTLNERVEMVVDAVAGLSRVDVGSFNSLLVDFAKERKAAVIVKGLRAISDFEHEFQMAHLNKKLDDSLETVFMMASPEFMFLSSSAVKEIAAFGGDVSGLVPQNVRQLLTNKFSQ